MPVSLEQPACITPPAWRDVQVGSDVGMRALDREDHTNRFDAPGDRSTRRGNDLVQIRAARTLRVADNDIFANHRSDALLRMYRNEHSLWGVL